MYLRRLLLLMVVIIFCLAARQDAQSNLTPVQHKQLDASFEKVWRTVKQRHFDPKLGGLNWKKIRKEYRPRIIRAKTMNEGRAIINEMLGLLKQSHLKVIPGAVYSQDNDYTPGLDLRVLDGRAIVTRVEPESPASAAGIMQGWEITEVFGRAVEPIIKRVESDYPIDTQKGEIKHSLIMSLIQGNPDTNIDIQFGDAAGNLISHKLYRAAPRGAKIRDGKLPPFPFWIDINELENGIRVVKFNYWIAQNSIRDEFIKLVRQKDSINGVIIDLRGNHGGQAGIALLVAGAFFDMNAPQNLTTSYFRKHSRKYYTAKWSSYITAPLAVLVDDCSASTSELFAAGMQDLKRAVIFGSLTAGNCLGSNFMLLPNGDRFQYSVAVVFSPGGKRLEGSGVQPDQEIKLTQADLLEGKDPVLEQAVSWLLSQ